MSVLSVLLLVFFIIVAILLVLLVLVQSEEGDSLGGIFAGGSSSAFGSRSGNVLTRATTVLGALFLILSFGLAMMNRNSGGSGVERAARELAPAGNSLWYLEDGASGGGVDSDLPLEIPGDTGGPGDTGSGE